MGAFYPQNDAVYFEKEEDAVSFAQTIWISGGQMGKPIVHLVADGKESNISITYQNQINSMISTFSPITPK